MTDDGHATSFNESAVEKMTKWIEMYHRASAQHSSTTRKCQPFVSFFLEPPVILDRGTAVHHHPKNGVGEDDRIAPTLAGVLATP
eukprot:CAMPEP_0119572332 /NCGR_PEP_ID=MMETSP1352-20130426/44571_1 /TAXON_ID=265584 /ORGANISM="Stauroneis constricta, Strain CCMP1120" /LENGTH=84 /DNA_ID=CAMNT_0007622017 /DNA_START=459 /DNA_END=713 /DNA_ORIENTATION=-